MSTHTEQFGQVAAAARATAREFQVDPSQVLVVLAVAEHGDGVRSDVLEQAMGSHPTAIRRALSLLYKGKFATAVASDGGPRRRGYRSCVSLTSKGEHLAKNVQTRIAAIETARAAERAAA